MAQGKKLIEVLKSIITCETININAKNMQPMTIRSLLRMMMTTNRKCMIPLSGKDRRFCIIECNCEKLFVEFEDYFKPLVQFIGNKQNQRAFYDYLMTVDIEGYRFPDERPESEIANSIKSIHLPLPLKYFIYLSQIDQPRTKFTSITDFTNQFIENVKLFERLPNYYISDANFRSEIIPYYLNKPKGFIDNPRAGHNVKYTIDYDKMIKFLVQNKYINDPNPGNNYMFREDCV